MAVHVVSLCLIVRLGESKRAIYISIWQPWWQQAAMHIRWACPPLLNVTAEWRCQSSLLTFYATAAAVSNAQYFFSLLRALKGDKDSSLNV